MNGHSAASLMTWRISAEAAIQNALEQLTSYRRMTQSDGLTALAQALDEAESLASSQTA